MPESSNKNESLSSKSQKRNGNINPSEKKKRKDLLIANILSGDLSIVKKYFFWMIGKGYFKNMRQRLTSEELQLWVDDLSQEVSMAVYSKSVDEAKIVKIKSFIFKIILYQSLDEDKRIGRTEPIDDNVYEHPSFERRPNAHATY